MNEVTTLLFITQHCQQQQTWFLETFTLKETGRISFYLLFQSNPLIHSYLIGFQCLKCHFRVYVCLFAKVTNKILKLK